jgi:pimeloyl-ACP methyl ester carboxylesterase
MTGEVMRIKINHANLAAVLHRPAESTSSGVVICHGLLASKDSPKHVQTARRLAQLGHAVLRFDFQGRGESSGDLLGLTFERQVDECLGAISALRKETGVDRVGLLGSSMGGAVAILCAEEPVVKALVTQAAVGRTDLLGARAVGPKAMRVWERKGFLRIEGEAIGYSFVESGRQNKVLAAAGRRTCPWLIVHGGQDKVVPVSDAKALLSAGKNACLEVISGADHSFSDPDHLGRLVGMSVDFLHEKLS